MSSTPHPFDDEPLLAGITVLDISQGVAGPYCGLLLRQQGARVIKIEPPAGDWSRQMGRSRDGQTAISVACNAGKHSVVLDTRAPEGRAALQALALRADVVLQNFRPGVAARMGADPVQLAAGNPRLVYVSISGYGSEGPMAGLPALDTTMQAYGGLMHANRDPATGQPRRIGLLLADLATALYAAQCATAALLRAARTGRGRHLELSMLQVCAALQSYLVIEGALFPGAEASAFNAPTGLFPVADGMLYLSMLDDAMFARLCKTMGFDDWLQDPALRSSAGRLPQAQHLSARLAQALLHQPLAHWERLLKDNDILFGRVRHPFEMLDDPQSAHLFQRTPGHCAWPDLPLPRLPGQTHATDAQALVPPALGEHTQAVLREFGLR